MATQSEAQGRQATRFNVAAIVQGGRLQYEALLLAASLRASDPDFAGRLILLEPQPGGAWPEDPRITGDATRAALDRLGAEIVPFDARHFGASYPYGNKIEALAALPAGEPFLFLDTDTLITGPLSRVDFDFARPSASMRREGTWPEIELYGPGYTEIWSSLYDRFGLDFARSLDLSWPDEYWQRYLYFNAGWFFHADPHVFGARFLDYARNVRDDPPAQLVCQSLDPWLDQVVLPLVIHSLGGGRPGPSLAGLDGEITCHWRVLSLLYARESVRAVDLLEEIARTNWIKKALREYEPVRRLVYQGKGRLVRDMFDRPNLPRPEQKIRQKIKAAGLWLR
ncbi:hypothetical protein CLV78_102145 [Aliiruegeria haliotis]|uniref:Uncharacterized protein n=1 Tax=Aliiruegeria haliotis TaxID=1280846 RepID=A0A2T0RUW2_9RHOB|nr:hypothetical protein [Aliiruegeria haliotis]PRY24971.1 hypothetical protein CLV78_102145 [Aliiruegeria haliotis]